MKQLQVLLSLCVASTTAFAQGTIAFNNRIPSVVDARVLLPDGTGAGVGWKAQLYAGAHGISLDRLSPVTPSTGFRTSSGATAGYVNGIDVTVPGVPPEGMSTVVLRAYNGASYETSQLRGESPPIAVKLGGGIIPPANLKGLQGFTVGPNPNAIQLVVSAGPHGGVNPSGPILRLKGESVSLMAFPEANFTVQEWKVDGGVAQEGGTAFALNNVQNSHEVTVTFKSSIDQGTVLFNNRVPGIVDARVLLSDGTAAGAGWTAQLYVGAEGTAVNDLQPLMPTTQFRTSSLEAHGYVQPLEVSVPKLAPNSTAQLVMRVYDGDSYETSKRRGQSSPVTVRLGGGVLPPANLIGLHSFTVPLEDPVPANHGLVNFNNRIPGLVDARVLLPNGAGAGVGWTAQLYAGAEGSVLMPLFPKTTFRTTSSAAMGYVVPVDVVLPSVSPGSKATIVLAAYNGDSFETSTMFGQSAPITVTVGGGKVPPANLVGLEGFQVGASAPPPRILSQPAALSVRAGSRAAFHVVAQGEGGLQYQWRFNQQPLDNATSASLLLENVQLRHAGAYSVVVSNASGSVTSAEALLTVLTQPQHVRGDLNGDGKTDLVFQDADGFLAAWFMDKANLKSAAFLNPNNTRDKDWRLIGADDFNQDNQGDLLFQHETGALAVWLMDGINRATATFINPIGPKDKDWRVSAIGDFNQDSKPDLVFQHEDGTLAIWHLDGVTLTSGVLVEPGHPGSDQWRVVGSGDFNQDGRSDLVFQHEDGTLAAWHMHGSRLEKAGLLDPSHPIDEDWRVASVADLDVDGQSDLLFQHRDGSLAVWYMNSAKLRAAQLLNPDHPGHNWRLATP